MVFFTKKNISYSGLMTRVVKEGLEELQTGGLSAREAFQVPALVRGGPVVPQDMLAASLEISK